MKKNTNQFNGSHADRINNGGGRFRRIALFPLMWLMLLLVPTSMMAQTDYDNTVTFTALAGNPQGFTNETYAKLFDGKKTEGDFSKWCCKISGSANVIFAASKAGVPVGYTITTGNDNFTSKGRNPMSWKLYGNNVGKDGEWTLIQEVNNDTKLQDVNYTSYDFTCGGGKSYKYFKWEISAIHSGDVLQVGEFELKLQTCTHTNADGSSALGNAIKTVETTCTEHGYTTYKCSICHSIVKKYKTDELKKHTLTYHEAKDGVKEHWQCDVCHKYFSDADATQEVSYASLLYPAYAVFEGSTGTLTFKCSPSKPEGAYDLNRDWKAISRNIKKVVFDASFANARPTSCYMWFYGCFYLTTIEGIEYFNTENVTNMRYMFGGCRSLKSLDLTNFNTENVTDMYYMFYNCTSLESLDLTNFNTAKVTNMTDMFRKCSALKTIYASDKFVTDQVTEGSDMFYHCFNLKDYSSSKEDHTYANCGPTGYFTYGSGYAMFDDATGTLTFSYKGFKPEGAYELNEGGNTPEWISKNSYVKKVVFDASFAKARPTSCYYWFRGCDMLTQIEGIEHLNTEEVTDMSWMFMDCRGLTSLDVSHFNTQKVTNMEHMFNRCSGLTSLDVSSFNTENVTNMTCIFLGCSGLTSLDVSHFNTKKVTDMSCMFYECGKLTSLDVSHFNTGNVTDMSFMFFNCSALTLLDLTNFNTAKVVDMGGMLIDCSALTTIYVSDKFVTTNITERGSMFYGCTSLKGAIAYDENKFDDTYANYETGYFSKLVGMNGNEKIGASGETLTAASLALADDKDFVAYEPFTATTATYNREMKAGTTWATLCLPYEVSLTGQKFRAFSLLSANEGSIELKEVETSIAAGTPVIIKMNNGETTLSFSEANKEIAQKVVSADGSYQLQGLYTKKVFDKDADNNCYIVKGDKLMNPTKLLENTSTTQVGSKPFRAYMVDNSTAPAAGAKMFSIGFDDSTTAIDSLNTIADDNAIYYDLQGNRLNAPQKGINIVKRGNKTMKVIIK
ncbi:BspA family leucine-rich repeat surface protein [Segatella copri]|uniref:BspA family leucine-rich repeat surface protein n=1 Tax=Segatella copri TaxID=165179 RepID=A0AAW9TDU8_9BACT|nr:BspA family leucine-rich repeat surface protein [Segatella copri]MQN27305.1 BspA family leucine-rich repeat surface protein [Segatella copri]MQN32173.1 BspA family leucine-rich repeat surface protein [Segatella copri]MQN37070.1 BspA family leucine-rich repeat surface protein [Segatella copri]MQN74389.1 BspA family leucine-rich repeat surface protein [Segatella copri]MQO26011.1 BspA family leucine-rich repeat surface protein [Segatella copri]